MEKELWVVYFESANYCGYGEHCLVWAYDEEDALDADDFYMEQDEDQYIEENGEDALDNVIWSVIKRAFPLASEEAANFRGYLQDESQKHFYPIVN